MKQAGAELGQAQLIMGLGCINMINKKYQARLLVLFCSLCRPTLPFTPFKPDLISIASYI